MSTILNFGRDVQGYNAYAPQFATDKYFATITNGVPQDLVIPSTHSTWIISIVPGAGGNIWVSHNNLVGLPTDDTFTSTASELNPGPRTVFAGDVISVITDQTTCDVSVILYAVA